MSAEAGADIEQDYDDRLRVRCGVLRAVARSQRALDDLEQAVRLARLLSELVAVRRKAWEMASAEAEEIVKLAGEVL